MDCRPRCVLHSRRRHPACCGFRDPAPYRRPSDSRQPRVAGFGDRSSIACQMCGLRLETPDELNWPGAVPSGSDPMDQDAPRVPAVRRRWPSLRRQPSEVAGLGGERRDSLLDRSSDPSRAPRRGSGSCWPAVDGASMTARSAYSQMGSDGVRSCTLSLCERTAAATSSLPGGRGLSLVRHGRLLGRQDSTIVIPPSRASVASALRWVPPVLLS
jgi:hypothetical protein